VKKRLESLIVVVLMMLVSTSALAEEVVLLGDTTDTISITAAEQITVCPFSVRNNIRFGMSPEEVEAAEDAVLQERYSIYDDEDMYELPTPLSLGGLDGYVLRYGFTDNVLTRIEYFFEYPEVFSIEYANSGYYSYNKMMEFKEWMGNVDIIRQSLETKYGAITEDDSSSIEYSYVWNVIYDDCLCGVDISLAAEYNPYIGVGGVWCNRVTYTPHDYQADIDAYNAQKETILNTAEDL
jgi:hypothetical protein